MKKLSLILTAAATLLTATAGAEVRNCATVANRKDPAATYQLQIPDGAQMEDLSQTALDPVYGTSQGTWDNRISKITVAAGCQFAGYQYKYYNVDSETSGEIIDASVITIDNTTATDGRSIVRFLGKGEDNRISSLTCTCDAPTPTPAPAPEPTPENP